MGVSLFHRTTRTVALTDAGARYARDVAEALTLIESATRDIERRGKSDILTVHCVPSLAARMADCRASPASAPSTTASTCG